MFCSPPLSTDLPIARRISSQPDPCHCLRVAQLVREDFRCDDDDVEMAALLHDVLEFNPKATEALARSVGSKIAGWVERLTWRGQGSSATYWDRLIESPWQVRLVKMADALDDLHARPEYRQAKLRTASLAVSLGYDCHPSLTIAVVALREAMGSSGTLITN
jgi:(p)ppGpp synthase/HD superfamily hydrolase